MAGPSGLTGLTGRSIYNNPEAPAEVVHGGYVDPKHSQWGETARPYPYQVIQFGDDPLPFTGADVAMVGEYDPMPPAGDGSDDPEFDRTPYGTHAAPWPKNAAGDGSTSPDNIARQLEQSRIIHGTKTNASAKSLMSVGQNPQQDQWMEYQSLTPGTSLQPKGVPQQVAITAGGYGSRDRTATVAPQNSYGFDSAHLHRRVATGPMPLNYLWMGGKGRPMVRTLPGGMRLPIGPGPFQGDDPSATFGVQGAVLTATPTDYIPPPEPAIAPAPQTGGVVFDPGWW